MSCGILKGNLIPSKATTHTLLRRTGPPLNMEALRESFLNVTFQMSPYKRATLDEEELVDSTSEDIYPSSPMQVNGPLTEPPTEHDASFMWLLG